MFKCKFCGNKYENEYVAEDCDSKHERSESG